MSKEVIDQVHRATQCRVQKVTLGALIEEFGRAAAELDGYWVDELQKMLDARNKLVHHFYRNPRFNLLSDEGVASAIAYLDERRCSLS